MNHHGQARTERCAWRRGLGAGAQSPRSAAALTVKPTHTAVLQADNPALPSSCALFSSKAMASAHSAARHNWVTSVVMSSCSCGTPHPDALDGSLQPCRGGWSRRSR